MHERNRNVIWQQIIATPGFIDKDGLRDANINDAYTPVGTFTIKDRWAGRRLLAISMSRFSTMPSSQSI